MKISTPLEALFIKKAQALHQFNSMDLSDIAYTTTIQDLAPIATRIIDRSKTDLAIGIGPMTSGTNRTLDHNLMIFDRAYDHAVINIGLSVFYQLAFEVDIRRLRKKLFHENNEGFVKVLSNDFYKPILKHQKITTVLLMPDWHKSLGATIEREILNRRGGLKFIDIERLLPNIVADSAKAL